MVPGEHHAHAHVHRTGANGEFKVLEDLGVIDPRESEVNALAAA